jgi:hypothetical protein
LTPLNASIKAEEFNQAFAVIGLTGNTRMPRSKQHNEPVAWEYHVASHLKRIAEARREKAAKAAVAAGVMFDPADQPLPIGTNSLVYAGDVVEISVKVTTPSAKFDIKRFVEDLQQAGVSVVLLNRLLAKHTSENRAPHAFTSTIVTG